MLQVKLSVWATPWRYAIAPLLLVICLIVLPVLAWQINMAGLAIQNGYRAAQLDHSRWQRYLALLSKAPMQSLAGSSNRTDFEVALREVAQSLQQQAAIQIDSFVVAPGDELVVEDELGTPITPTTVRFEATLNHAPALLTILSELEAVAQWRVMEVRGCAMQRLASEPRLATACSIDIYHWSWKAY